MKAWVIAQDDEYWSDSTGWYGKLSNASLYRTKKDINELHEDEKAVRVEIKVINKGK